MTASHTPGPWHIVVRASINGARIASSDGTVVGGVSSAADKPLDQKHADARLIASAPDLLEALTYARTTIRLALVVNGDDENASAIIARIDAAIAKATGQ